VDLSWFWASDYSVARFVLERGIALIYLLAFVSALHQFPALLGVRGLLPVPRHLAYLPSASRRACSTSATPMRACGWLPEPGPRYRSSCWWDSRRQLRSP
jgi:hypothetical protein